MPECHVSAVVNSGFSTNGDGKMKKKPQNQNQESTEVSGVKIVFNEDGTKTVTDFGRPAAPILLHETVAKANTKLKAAGLPEMPISQPTRPDRSAALELAAYDTTGWPRLPEVGAEIELSHIVYGGLATIVAIKHTSNVAGKPGAKELLRDHRGEVFQISLYTLKQHGRIVKEAPP